MDAIETIIQRHDLNRILDRNDLVIVDCRFELGDKMAGRSAYQAGHIPGAVYADLDRDLSGPPLTDRGRHPLPSPAAMTSLFGKLGIDATKQVVVYDANNGGIASRLWWMLRYMDHKAVAVLDGGWRAWQSAGLGSRAGVEENLQALFVGTPRRRMLVTLDEIQPQMMLVDSRAPERYRGDIEPIDPRAGHIPGALNHFYQDNLLEDGRLAPVEVLREGFSGTLGGTADGQAVFYCGSGVTACANLVALAHAGLGDARLYVGSWSEWCSDPKLPGAIGPDPG